MIFLNDKNIIKNFIGIYKILFCWNRLCKSCITCGRKITWEFSISLSQVYLVTCCVRRFSRSLIIITLLLLISNYYLITTLSSLLFIFYFLNYIVRVILKTCIPDGFLLLCTFNESVNKPTLITFNYFLFIVISA